ncbi:MAG: hypothetical protein Sv326_1185 [Candidatus Fermentimicrarchaeum limneticum]|uniref:Uncharacterized protein n=1 Tax=Fermentimicrarchaeum limneticum TaxID=2795018 RepID=A0A7D6BGC7_FERL1|nr:MAG: hypothetical protein Sv326_1185 [Candidatus Fermentimicrarchaeum limneticum]
MGEQEPVATSETDEVKEEEELEKLELPFPNARVVRILKKNFQKEHQIRRDVKISANELLGRILNDVAKAMDNEEFYTLSIEHFNKASKKYRSVDLQAKRFARIKQLLMKQRAELEEVIMEMEHSEEEF